MKIISKVTKRNGRVISKTGSYKYVLITTDDRNLNKWSNKKETLEKEVRHLVKHGWNELELTIMETEIGYHSWMNKLY